MDEVTYPGKGLSLPELAFALNEELKRVAYSPRFTSDTVSQVDRDVSSALAAIREWGNSFAHVNRIPSDVLSLIPTHLSSQKDRFLATFVCRHWRRVFLHHGALWSQLYLSKGEDYVTTLLGRAKGSTLDVVTGHNASLSTISSLSPRAQRIQSLDFTLNCWADVLKFPEAISGSLPLLRTLKIFTSFHDQSLPGATLSPPFFGGAINLQEFTFSSEMLQFLSFFTFPNLTTFQLTVPPVGWLIASHLLDFLRTTSTLRTVNLGMSGTILLESFPRGTTVVLPNVETFFLLVLNGDGIYDFATRLSCPRANHAVLAYEVYDINVASDIETFPASAPWNAIVHQHTRSPVEEVIFEIDPDHLGPFIAYSLTFQSSDMTILRLDFEIVDTVADDDELLSMGHNEMVLKPFYEACRTIRDHPLLPNIKRLYIKSGSMISNPASRPLMVDEVLGLFRSLGSLDKLTIDSADLQKYLAPYLDPPESEHPAPFPSVKELTISNPWMAGRGLDCLDAIVGLAKSQHGLGIPFDRVTIRASELPVAMAERLRQWVSEVDCAETPDV